MIFYFTGTGNSGYVAKELSKTHNEELVSISKLINEGNSLEFSLKDDEIIGFVYPIYAWSPPKMVIDFIKKIKLNNYKGNYVFSVCTCGESTGKALDIIKRELNKKSIMLNSGFTVIMPNNYMIFGDVNSKELTEEKLKNADIKISTINKSIKEKNNTIFECDKGIIATISTHLISHGFEKFACNINKFNVDNNCISCGKCEKNCNSKAIKILDGKPTWSGYCCQCLACINNCPTKSIQYGKSTFKKGRYTNPKYN